MCDVSQDMLSSLRAVLCWAHVDGRYRLHSSWCTADTLPFVQGSCEYSFDSGAGLIGRMDTSNQHCICSQFINTDTCVSMYHRKALALSNVISLVRAIKHNSMVYEFVAQPGEFISDTVILEYCAGSQKMFEVP